MIDTNSHLLQWPFRSVRLNATDRLIDSLRAIGFTSAGAGDRILSGTHAPLFYQESAVLKRRESGLPEEVHELIRHRNGLSLMATAGKPD